MRTVKSVPTFQTNPQHLICKTQTYLRKQTMTAKIMSSQLLTSVFQSNHPKNIPNNWHRFASKFFIRNCRHFLSIASINKNACLLIFLCHLEGQQQFHVSESSETSTYSIVMECTMFNSQKKLICNYGRTNWKKQSSTYRTHKGSYSGRDCNLLGCDVV
jgi:hypothetical protein